MRLLLVVFLMLSLPLRANLGDSVEQCVQRYGKPLGFSEANPNSPFGSVAFAAGGYTLVVFLSGTKEVGARISKTNRGSFSDAEIKNILDSDNVPPWTLSSTPEPDTLQWSRDDKATASYDIKAKVIIITTPVMLEIMHQAEAAKKEAPKVGPAASPVQPAPPKSSVPIAPPVPTPWPTIAPATPATNAPVGNP